MRMEPSEDSPIRERRSRRGEPTWEIARLFPLQGEWTEEEYMTLDTKELIEFSDGCLEFWPRPTLLHQWIVQYMLKALHNCELAHPPGQVVLGPLPVRLWPGKLREPDLVYL